MWVPILALAASSWVAAEHSKARLIANDAIAPGGSATIALELVAEEGWHTYWVNPGDAGMATRVEWTLPNGWRAGELAWPAPVRFESDGIVSYGYEGRVVLPATLTAPAGAKAGVKKTVKVRAKASWLVCREVCLPGEAELTLSIPVKKGAKEEPLGTVPEEVRWPATIGAAGGAFRLVVESPERLDDAYFFAETGGIVDPAAAQSLTKAEDGSYSMTLPRAANAKLDGVREIRGVLVSGGRAWRITAQVEKPR